MFEYPSLGTQSAAASSGHVCAELAALAGGEQDTVPVIENCIASAPAGSTVELPPGTYAIASRLIVSRRVRLRTEGKDLSSPGCTISDATCATLVVSPEYLGPTNQSEFVFTAQGTVVDHLIFDGNRSNRLSTQAASLCASGSQTKSPLVWSTIPSNGTFAGNVFKNALCGSAFVLIPQSPGSQNMQVVGNVSAYNGDHSHHGMWADGFTIHDGSGIEFENNLALDNTDVDVVFGGCQDCTIRGNTIVHDGDFAQSSFAALVIASWPQTSGDYQGTAVSGNSIDCGPAYGCGFGLSLGSHAWYDTASFGGEVHGNSIAFAQAGLNIDSGGAHPVHSVAVYNNTVEHTAPYTYTSVGLIPTSAYNLAPGAGAATIDTSKDTSGAVYSNFTWQPGMIPNQAPVPSS